MSEQITDRYSLDRILGTSSSSTRNDDRGNMENDEFEGETAYSIIDPTKVRELFDRIINRDVGDLSGGSAALEAHAASQPDSSVSEPMPPANASRVLFVYNMLLSPLRRSPCP